MTEIDFDELDKAVNNLMGNIKPPKNSDEEPKAKTLEVKDTLQPGEEPEYDKLGEVAQNIGNEAQETDREQTLVEYFDPSKLTEDSEFDKLGEVAKNIGNEALDSGRDVDIVQQVASMLPPEKQADKLDDSTEPKISEPAEMSRPLATRRSTSGRFMDVVHPSSAMRPAQTVTSQSRAENVPVPARSSIDAVPSESDESRTEEPAYTTPFLPDARGMVDKRPLGAPLTPAEDVEELKETSTVDTNETPVVETTLINNEDTGEEKTDDIQQVVDATDVTMELAVAEERALQEIESKEITVDQSASSSVKGDTIEVAGQDRHDSKNTEDTTTAGAIYDVGEYHQPLPAKKRKSSWGKMILVLLAVLILGALAGAAYYMLSMSH